jgi:hypothetical protein
MKLPLRQAKSRKGGWMIRNLLQRSRGFDALPVKAKPASRKRALQGWWQHDS